MSAARSALQPHFGSITLKTLQKSKYFKDSHNPLVVYKYVGQREPKESRQTIDVFAQMFKVYTGTAPKAQHWWQKPKLRFVLADKLVFPTSGDLVLLKVPVSKNNKGQFSIPQFTIPKKGSPIVELITGFLNNLTDEQQRQIKGRADQLLDENFPKRGYRPVFDITG